MWGCFYIPSQTIVEREIGTGLPRVLHIAADTRLSGSMAWITCAQRYLLYDVRDEVIDGRELDEG
jgi:hypothetical protein